MTRGKVQLAFIVDAAKRKAMYKRKRNELMRKMNELSNLCGIDVCAIIECSELSPQFEFWPSELDAKRMLIEYQKNLLEERIAKTKKELEIVLQANREKELTQVMFDCVAGRSGLENLGMEDLVALGRLIDQKLDDVEKQIESLSENNLSQVGGNN